MTTAERGTGGGDQILVPRSSAGACDFLDAGASYRSDGYVRACLRAVRDVLALPVHIDRDVQRDLVKHIDETFAEIHAMERRNGPPAFE